jgi:ADP-dependent NAD(P)H-hydrate dehydratase / NAD(P)H-hydrate epimerase
MITALDSKVADRNSESLGVSTDKLMDNAGEAVATLLRERFSGSRFAIVCGCGNNGGDGFATANHMLGEDVTVLLLEPEKDIHTPVAISQLSRVSCPIKTFTDSELNGYDLLVDCALGIGVKGHLRPPYDTYVKATRKFQGKKVSVDVPSGLGTDLAVNPDVTITFDDVKEGMTAQNSGEIVIVDIGVPKDAYKCTGPGDLLRYPIPDRNSHKGNNGRLLVIGGGPYFGAPAMTALAAMRVGADLVRIATPSSSYHEVASQCPVFVMTELGGKTLNHSHVRQLLDLAENNDAVVIGPGLGRDEHTFEAIKEFVSLCKTPMVIDADGLIALGPSFSNKKVPTVLTPHAREFRELGGTSGDILDVNRLASRLNSVVVLKGPEDIISDGIRTKLNRSGTPAMTSAGTGDVLAGLIGGLMAKGMPAYEAAYLGTYISGKAGERAYDEFSYGMMATDVIDMVPKVLKEGLEQ